MAPSLKDRIRRFEPAVLGEDLSTLHTDDRAALKHLVEVCHRFDNIYFSQVWRGNPALREALRARAGESEADADRYLCFDLNRGPWDRTADHEPFVEDVPARNPAGANFYPEDMTREEWEAWLTTLDPEELARAKGFYHVIRRAPPVGDDQKGALTCIPYATEYRDELEPAAAALKAAAGLVRPRHPTLASFLEQRADAFLSNDYLPSELTWLAVAAAPECPLEITCGPYEVYTDELNGSKAAFEMYIHWRDATESSRLDAFTHALTLVEKRLPIPDRIKRQDLTPPPIVVVNELLNAGDVGVPMTAAYNLPNDEEAVRRGGSRLTIIKNVQEQKYEKVLVPIAHQVVAEDQLPHLAFVAFFTHVLLHEVAHSNGPQTVTEGLGDALATSEVGGYAHTFWNWLSGSAQDPSQSATAAPTTVRSRLQEYYSTMEEAKADITGLFAAAELIDEGIIKDISLESFYVTYLASAFRSIRFGLNEAHGRGQAIQLNYLTDRQAFAVDPDTGRFRVQMDRMRQAVSDLTHDIILLQARGDKAKVAAFVKELGIIRPATQAALDKLADIPVDIRPRFQLNDQV
ncbi:hypothetical protein IWQ60_001103 [Tieghemiomyces parasiticus]|uniref:Nudix hydrolase 3 n=1 Tax=Tieghemiomyces parasiticus TaxID=78921 RepID=A0A9W8E2U1_9FUNG|nr:hypothetical protein IWQ60_001103 [Tieghemiomyces parasiticus]